jgi:Kef-type K+ transport system membrane component KefB
VSVASFLLALIAIFLAAKLFGEVAERLGQPAVLGELVGGVVIGVSGLRLVDPSDHTIHLLAELGVIFLLFLIGLETDLRKLLSVGGSAAVVAIVGVGLPFAGGYALGTIYGFGTLISAFLGAALTATSVGITARVLSDLGHLHDDESQVILGAAVVDDIIGLVILAIVSAFAAGQGVSTLGALRIVGVAFGFVIVAVAVGSFLAPRIVRLLERIEVARALLFTAVMSALILAYTAERVGSAVVIGAFAAGLVLTRCDPEQRIERELRSLANFFIPIFFVSVGAAVDFRSLNMRILGIALALTVIGVIGKVLAGFTALRRGLRRLVIGVGMVPRGEVGLIFAQIGLASGALDAGLYSAVTLMVILTTFITPLALRALLPRGVATELHGHADYVMDAPMDDERG